MVRRGWSVARFAIVNVPFQRVGCLVASDGHLYVSFRLLDDFDLSKSDRLPKT
jgi:hypothetical protein